ADAETASDYAGDIGDLASEYRVPSFRALAYVQSITTVHSVSGVFQSLPLRKSERRRLACRMWRCGPGWWSGNCRKKMGGNFFSSRKISSRLALSSCAELITRLLGFRRRSGRGA